MSKVDLNLSMQSVPSFFGAPIGDIEDLSEKKIAVAGLFCDHFSQGEPGARYAARQLRYASTPLLANGLKISTPSNIIDVGELNVFPIEPIKTQSILEEQSSRIQQTGARLLALGGDYSLIPALVSGQLKRKTRLSFEIYSNFTQSGCSRNPSCTKKPNESFICNKTNC